jgi:Arm DNA-binding domain
LLETRIWDAEIKGFFLRVYPSGWKVYALKYRVAGRQHIHTLGVHRSPLTPNEARAAAEARRQAKNGEDPSAEKRPFERRVGVTAVYTRRDGYLTDRTRTPPFPFVFLPFCSTLGVSAH